MATTGTTEAAAPLFDLAIFDGIEPSRVEIIETVRKLDGKTVYGVKFYPRGKRDGWMDPYRQDTLELALGLIQIAESLPDRPAKETRPSSAKSIDAATLKARLAAMQAGTNGTAEAADVKV